MQHRSQGSARERQRAVAQPAGEEMEGGWHEDRGSGFVNVGARQSSHGVALRRRSMASVHMRKARMRRESGREAPRRTHRAAHGSVAPTARALSLALAPTRASRS